MSNVDRVVIKYQEAASEFDRMAQAANEMAQQTNQVKNVTSSVVGSGWVGRDAQSASLAIQSYSALLKRKAEQLKEANNILIEDTRAMQEQESNNEKLFNSWH